MKKFLFLFLTFWGITTGGCAYKYQYMTGEEPEPQKKVTEWRHIAIWGHLSAEPFDLEKACPQGVAEFGSYISFPNWLCTFLTIGIYSPVTVYAIPAIYAIPARKKEKLQ